jgi:hypothetical protein
VGEGQGTEVSDETGQESPTQNECSGEGKDCGVSQSAVEKGQSSRQKHPVNQRIKIEATGKYFPANPSG